MFIRISRPLILISVQLVMHLDVTTVPENAVVHLIFNTKMSLFYNVFILTTPPISAISPDYTKSTFLDSPTVDKGIYMTDQSLQAIACMPVFFLRTLSDVATTHSKNSPHASLLPNSFLAPIMYCNE